MLSLILMVLLIKVAFSGKALIEQAIENGQSVTIHLASGDIEGKPHKTPSVQQAEANALPSVTPLTQLPGKEGLNPAPLLILTEQSDKGVLPTISPDGIMPWKYYARPYQQKEKRPLVAIIFTNIGLSKSLSESTLKLPHNFTLSLSPYASDIGRWAVKSRSEGFESLADLPVQAENYPLSDPGPYGLMEDLSPDQNIIRLHSILMQFPAFIGMLASVGEKMTANKEEIKPYLVELKKRGLLFFYVKTAKNAGLEEFAKTNSFYALGIDKIVDDDVMRSSVEAQLRSLAEIAKSNGYAIGLAHTYPTTVETVQNWIDELKDQGIDLVPVSAIANKAFQ